MYLYINQAQYNELHAINNAMIINEQVVYNGVNYAPNGVIVYRFSESEFKAYDARCTHNHVEGHRLEIFDNYKAKCTVCGSSFELIYGSPLSGPANYSLLEYQTRLEGNTLYINN
jgi:nitrite reductase/ring-hydroxylating ferredoxin subunit